MSKFLDNAPEQIQELVGFLKGVIKDSLYDGHVFITGGCVRDVLLGRGDQIRNVDLAIDLYDGGTSFSNWLTFKTKCYKYNENPIYLMTMDLALLHLTNDERFSDILIEVVQTRKGKNGHKSRLFGTLEDDFKTRDFTINALYYDIVNDKILDPSGMGLKDLEARIIRCCDNPDDSFSASPIRMMRAIRFATNLDLGIEARTWLGMVTNSSKLKDETQTGKSCEFNDIITAEKPSKGIRMMTLTNIMGKLFPEMEKCQHVFCDLRPKRTVYEHTLECLDQTPPELDVRLAAFFHDQGKVMTHNNGFLYHQLESAIIAEETLLKMNYSLEITKRVCDAIEHHEDFSAWRGANIPGPRPIRRFMDKLNFNEQTISTTLDLIHANNITQMYGKRVNQVKGIKAKMDEIKANIEKAAENAKKSTLPITGNDLKEKLNLKPGPVFAALIRKARDEFAANPSLTKEQLLEILKVHLKLVL